MNNNELLLALSDLLDKKLEPIHNRLEKIESIIENNILPRLDRIEATIEHDILPRLKKLELSTENDILPRLKKLEVCTENDILPRLKKLEVCTENDVLPRLRTIESCYLSTYKRYEAGNDQLDAMQIDIDIMKGVLLDHSEKLQRIS